jgi:hypothetical protein
MRKEKTIMERRVGEREKERKKEREDRKKEREERECFYHKSRNRIPQVL